MRKFFQTKRMMSFVCVLFTAILSLCSINIINYHDLLTTSTQEEVYDENTNTSNENDNNTNSNEENNSQNDKNETNNNGSNTTPPENTDNTTDTGEEDDLDDVVGARDTWNNHASTSLSGSGTSSNPYKIRSAADLAYLTRSSANKSAYYELENNIDLSGYDWVPIDDFEGDFNGNGYTISNMTINTTNLLLGLFSSLDNGGYIENFILTGSIDFSLSGTVPSNREYYIGSVVGFVGGASYPYATQVQEVASFVDINFSCNILSSSADNSPHFYIGGIAGATDSDGQVNIEECVYGGDIDVNQYMASRVNSNRTYCGGILGRAMTETYIEYCINYGSIGYSNQYSAYYTGGILGYAEVPSTDEEDNVSVYGCINYGSITVNNKSDDFRVGGIVGQMGENTRFSIFVPNDPTGSVEYCINYGNVTTVSNCKYRGQIAGYLDSEFDNVACKFPNIMFGERNESTGNWIADAYSDLNDVKYFMNYYLDYAYSDDNIYHTYTGVEFASNNLITNDYVTLGHFVRTVNVIVAVRNEDGGFTMIPNKARGYDVGYDTNMEIYRENSGDSNNYQYMFKSTSEYSIISSIYDNSKGKYEYIGLSTSMDEEDIFTDESSYAKNTYDMPSVIYVLFDLDQNDINFKVYYTEEITFNGEIPNTLYTGGVTGGRVSVSIGNGSQVNIGSGASFVVETNQRIDIYTSANYQYELCGVFAGDVGSDRTGSVNINRLFNPNVIMNDDLSEIHLWFSNTSIKNNGELVDEYSIVFSKYQYSNIYLSQHFESDRTPEVPEDYEYNQSTFFMYGYATRAFARYYTDRTARSDPEPHFYIQYSDGSITLIDDVFNLTSSAQVNDGGTTYQFNFYDNVGSYYVAETSFGNFYWLWQGAGFDFQTNNGEFDDTTMKYHGLQAINTAEPYFELNLFTYFLRENGVIYGNGVSYLDFRTLNGETAVRSAVINFKELAPVLSQNEYDVYFVDMFEEINSNDFSFGSQGGRLDIIYNNRTLDSTTFNIDNGVIGESGEEVSGKLIQNFQLNFNFQFIFDENNPLNSYIDTSNPIFNENDDSNQSAVQKLADLFTFRKQASFAYHDTFLNNLILTYDSSILNEIDMSEYSVYDLVTEISNSSNSIAQENLKNGNIVLYSIFDVNRFRLSVNLDSSYQAYSGRSAPFSVYVNGTRLTVQSDSTEKFYLENIKAYSEIEIIINDDVFFNTSGSTYQIYAYDSISNGSTFMSNQDSYHFQIIPEGNNPLLSYRVNYSTVSSFNSSYISSNITRVGNTWYIDEARDFYYLYYLNMYQGEDFSGIRLVQTENIDFGGAYIIPLGSATTPFSGYYDGQYYTISNFNISMGNTTDAGFFGYVDGAEIKNVTLLNGTVSGFSYVGGVVGYANNSTLTRLGNYSVDVSSTGRERSNNIFVYTSSNYLVALNANNVGSGVGKYDVLIDALMTDSSGNIAYTTSSQSSSYVGGFAGSVNGSTLNTCFSRGEINGNATERGGFVGRARSSSITYCYTTSSTFAGSLSSTTTSHYHTTNGRDIDEVCSTCADRFIW